ncbi:MAG: hypothetical protein K0S47_1689 [Herbinix sp.]|jgi:signal peptidase II|nr:hypothetical protein [Herbinix sp.]
MKKIKPLLFFLVLISFDQISKYWARTTLQEDGPLSIIPNVLKLQYHENDGAVWGIMSGKVPFLIVLTLVILSLLVYVFLKIPAEKKFNVLRIVFVFIMAGAIGNLIDRALIGYVTDFIYFELIDFPIFNIADCYLTVTCVLLFLLAVFYYKDEDFAFLDQMFRRIKKKSE